jgi:hypothetical protein
MRYMPGTSAQSVTKTPLSTPPPIITRTRITNPYAGQVTSRKLAGAIDDVDSVLIGTRSL